MSVLIAIGTGQPVPLQQRNPEIPEPLLELVQRLLAWHHYVAAPAPQTPRFTSLGETRPREVLPIYFYKGAYNVPLRAGIKPLLHVDGEGNRRLLQWRNRCIQYRDDSDAESFRMEYNPLILR